MISEGSCDTEDWNDDAGNFALNALALLSEYIQIETGYFKL